MSFLDLPVAHGRLEALWWPVESPKAAVVVCHPHPLFGGTLHNHVTYRLAQAFRAVQLHNGQITFNSQPGKGTTFNIRLKTVQSPTSNV